MPRRTTSDNSGAELRAWLLDEERELLAWMLLPSGTLVDDDHPLPPAPDLDDITEDDVMAFALSKGARALAAGQAYRLDRRDLPLDHPARRVGHLGDILVLTEHDELIEGR